MHPHLHPLHPLKLPLLPHPSPLLPHPLVVVRPLVHGLVMLTWMLGVIVTVRLVIVQLKSALVLSDKLVNIEVKLKEQ